MPVPPPLPGHRARYAYSGRGGVRTEQDPAPQDTARTGAAPTTLVPEDDEEATELGDDHDEFPLNQDLVAKVISYLPNTLKVLVRVAAVCTSWRAAVLEADPVRLSTALVCLNFQCPIRFPPSSHRHASGTPLPAVKRGRAAASPQLPVPRILHVAAAAGNVEGTLAIARMHEMRGDIDKAVGQWKLAAKANSAQAQFRIGELFYQGNTDLGRDSEEALLWLQRAAKNPECSVEHLSIAATMLGYLHMDGDGTKMDNIQATKWFAVGKANGNKEAEKTLGWMWNTGQFG